MYSEITEKLFYRKLSDVIMNLINILYFFN